MWVKSYWDKKDYLRRYHEIGEKNWCKIDKKSVMCKNWKYCTCLCVRGLFLTCFFFSKMSTLYFSFWLNFEKEGKHRRGRCLMCWYWCYCYCLCWCWWRTKKTATTTTMLINWIANCLGLRDVWCDGRVFCVCVCLFFTATQRNLYINDSTIVNALECRSHTLTQIHGQTETHTQFSLWNGQFCFVLSFIVCCLHVCLHVCTMCCVFFSSENLSAHSIYTAERGNKCRRHITNSVNYSKQIHLYK